jgi:hypothetical protein
MAQGLLVSTFAAYAITRAIESSRTYVRAAWILALLLAIVSVLFLSDGRTGYLAIFSMLTV